jgi:uncharacterized protein (DUF433 family)
MALAITNIPAPLYAHSDGVIRVVGTRVTLDTVVAAFLEGATAEEIQQQYPSLELPDAYSVIAYYLHNRIEVDAYLKQRVQQIAAVQRQNEARSSMAGVRERLLARKNGEVS